MNTLNLLSASEERPISRWLPQTGGLLAAAVVAFTLCRPPLLHTLSWGEIVSAAVARVVAVFAASAATALVSLPAAGGDERIQCAAPRATNFTRCPLARPSRAFHSREFGMDHSGGRRAHNHRYEILTSPSRPV